MTLYRYDSARTDGAMVSGEVEAASAGEANALLAARGLFPVRVAQAAAAERSAAPRRELAIAFRSLATLASAGVPLERALAASESLTRGSLREALASVRAELDQGCGLAAALRAQRGIMPGIVVGMISAGERGGTLPAALTEVARHLEEEAQLSAQVRQALAYPIVLAVAGLISTLVIGTVVIPRFADLLGDLGQEPPLTTRLLLGGATLASSYWWIALAAGIGVAWFLFDWTRRPDGRQLMHRALIAMPVVGPLRVTLATARVTRALGGMLSAGMPLLNALDAARDAAGDVVVAQRLAQARERVAEGTSLTSALTRAQSLSPVALQLIAIGESSGRLPDLLQRAGDLAAQESERALRGVVTFLEPALIVGFGAFVGFVAVALLQAVYSVRPM